jgi:uncharacterized protein (TIGR00255 family)
MTGYAAVRQPTSAGELSVSLRSVNHRGLDLHFHVSGELAPFENGIRKVLKTHLHRGHVEVRASLAAASEADGRALYNRELVGRYLAAFRQACLDFHLTGEPDLTRMLQQPGVLEQAREPRLLDEAFERDFLAIVARCATGLNEVRAREGEELRIAIGNEISQLEKGVAQIATVREHLSAQLTAKLRERIRVLLSDSEISTTRIVEEVAIQVDRSDVQEELTRLSIHAVELRRVLDQGGEVGKRLDFLLQEVNRETNTVLSKSSTVSEAGINLTAIGVGLKANIERMREQALNLE